MHIKAFARRAFDSPACEQDVMEVSDVLQYNSCGSTW